MIVLKIYMFAIIAILVLVCLKPIIGCIGEYIYIKIITPKPAPLPDATYDFKVKSDFNVDKNSLFYYILYSNDNKKWHMYDYYFKSIEDAKKRINEFCQRNRTVWTYVANAPQLDAHKDIEL